MGTQLDRRRQEHGLGELAASQLDDGRAWAVQRNEGSSDFLCLCELADGLVAIRETFGSIWGRQVCAMDWVVVVDDGLGSCK
ncbi:hypothetical protein M0R45_016668 [Rubus argutus]|uniref:Uncharacterized protein n=1 Tax=Rubus argutus TaxID=59490 RepID=A0AAW1XVQ6_RUBAR